MSTPYAYESGASYSNIPNERRTQALKNLLKNNLLACDAFPDAAPCVDAFDIDVLRDTVSKLKEAPFPTQSIHTFAVKANPVTKVLKEICQLGIGIEVASTTELIQAQRCGFSSSRTVYDSPAKTEKDILYALSHGVHMNADNFEELERTNRILTAGENELVISPSQRIGLRVNPQHMATKNGSSITSTSSSKFGVGLQCSKNEIVEAYMKYPWLNAVHVHCGSQGCKLDDLVSGARAVMDLVLEINEKRTAAPEEYNLISHMDIGGGLAVNYTSIDSDTQNPFSSYALKLKEVVPELWNEEFSIMTEFGRAIVGKAGFGVTRIEYTKKTGGRNIAIGHLGADYALRACYHPHQWMSQVSVYDRNGNFKPIPAHQEGGEEHLQDVAGPLCFSGDLIVRGVPLPPIEAGDYVLIHDTGAYHISMWSRYNSRNAPPTYGFVDIAPSSPPTSSPDVERGSEGESPPTLTNAKPPSTTPPPAAYAYSTKVPKRLEGYLEKLGNNKMNLAWKKRWFVLNSEEKTLSYYDKKEDIKPISTLNLSSGGRLDELLFGTPSKAFPEGAQCGFSITLSKSSIDEKDILTVTENNNTFMESAGGIVKGVLSKAVSSTRSLFPSPSDQAEERTFYFAACSDAERLGWLNGIKGSLNLMESSRDASRLSLIPPPPTNSVRSSLMKNLGLGPAANFLKDVDDGRTSPKLSREEYTFIDNHQVDANGSLRVVLLRERETIEDVLSFWG